MSRGYHAATSHNLVADAAPRGASIENSEEAVPLSNPTHQAHCGNDSLGGLATVLRAAGRELGVCIIIVRGSCMVPRFIAGVLGLLLHGSANRARPCDSRSLNLASSYFLL